MKVLLVRPRPHPKTIGLQSVMICEPLELEYLAAAVKGRHQVELVDMILERRPLGHFIREHRPRVVGITAYIAHVNVVKEYARVIKEIDPGIAVVVGGVHAEVVPGDFASEHIDYVISRDPIRSFSRLVDSLEIGGVSTIAHDRALTKTDCSSGTKFNSGCDRMNLNHNSSDLADLAREEAVPGIFPDRAITAKYRSKYYYVFHNPCALIKTSYGCPFSCNFCFCREVTGGRYFVRELTEVMEELKQISEPEVYIVDDNFLYDKQRVEEFCKLLAEHRINKRFLIYGRADFIAAHEDTVAKFAAQGLRAVIVGLESANPGELDKYNKHSSVTVNEKALEILAKYNVDCYATLILGIDWDEQDFARLYLWLKKWRLRFINLQPFTPLPGTSQFAQYEDRLIIPRARYEEWDLANLVVKPGKISARRFYYNILKVYFKTTLSFHNTLKHLSYGVIPSLKLSLGVTQITRQYLMKILKG